MVMPYFLGAHGPNTYVVNPAAWKTLPPDLKAIIQGEVISVAGDWYPRVRYKDLQTITDYQKKGLQISQIPDAEFAKIAAAGRQVLSTMVADKKDANFTAGAKSLEDFMKWRGYWQ
jgi:TRAP-type C4-dicarboxylate transport system substrate-binding protein